MFAFLQFLVLTVLSYAAFVGGIWALIDIARRGPESFVSAGKQTKVLWLVIVIVATAILFLALPYPFGGGRLSSFNFVALAAAAAVIVYHVGVKPALGTHRKGPKGGGRSTKGGW